MIKIDSKIRWIFWALVGLVGSVPGFHLTYGEHEYDLQFAPSDAWLPGETLPYYGSENPWDRRFFERAVPPRPGQLQLILIQEGRFEEAVALSRERLEFEVGNLEARLTLAIALGLQGRIEEAEASLQAALDHGLPPERVLVGPRSLFDPLRETATFEALRASSTGLLHGPMLGAVTDRSARFWVRTESESDIEIRVRSIDGGGGHKGHGQTRAESDFTSVIEVDGFETQTDYRYEVWIDGRRLPDQPEWHFRTFPSPAGKETVRIAFGGCAMYNPDYERMWDTIRLRDADAFLILGDNVYLDLPGPVGPFHDFSYYQRQSRPEFRRLVAGTPIYAIWDDHDAGIDDLFLGPYPDRPSWKVEHLDLFRRNWNNPGYGQSPDRPGVWFSIRIGAVEFFMLDGRYYRENPFLPQPSMLGPVQKAWLLDGLKNSDATFKLIVSPVPWPDDAKIREEFGPNGELLYATDTWAGYREERDEILDSIDEHDISGVLLLSGDRHRADLRSIERPNGYPLYDLMCSWLTNPEGASPSGNPIWEYLDGPSFAVLTIDPSGPDPSLAMEVATIEGVPVFNWELHLSDLSKP